MFTQHSYTITYILCNAFMFQINNGLTQGNLAIVANSVNPANLSNRFCGRALGTKTTTAANTASICSKYTYNRLNWVTISIISDARCLKFCAF